MGKESWRKRDFHIFTLFCFHASAPARNHWRYRKATKSGISPSLHGPHTKRLVTGSAVRYTYLLPVNQSITGGAKDF